jgi:hypothetical protein
VCGASVWRDCAARLCGATDMREHAAQGVTFGGRDGRARSCPLVPSPPVPVFYGHERARAGGQAGTGGHGRGQVQSGRERALVPVPARARPCPVRSRPSFYCGMTVAL